MKRAWLLVIVLLFPLAGIAWAQTTSDAPLFVPLRQIGELRPQGIVYDPVFDRFAWVDARQRLLLVDAASYQPQYTLYESGTYNSYTFSHDGRWLALAIERRIELWDTQTGQRAAVFEPAGANLVQGPLRFTPDDRFLLLDTVVPAPQALRRSENDTSIIPWLWDLEAARDERASRFASAEDGYAFFEYRNGLIVGANTVLIGGIPNRLMVLDGAQNSFPVVAEITANRFERDPIVVWRSASDALLYADPLTDGRIVQVDTRTRSAFPTLLGRDYAQTSIRDLEGLSIANNGRILCPASGLAETSLLRLIYGADYASYQNYQPLTFTLIDVLVPMTMSQEQGGLLIHTFNAQRGRGSIELVRPPDIQQMILSPDRTRLLVRRASGLQALELYNLETCALERIFYPAEPDGSGQHTLAFNADGSVIVSDFQRFDTFTGALLAHVVNITQGFERFSLSADGRTVVTLRGDRWQLWDVDSGRPLEQATLRLDGEVIDSTADAARYLLRSDSGAGITMSIVDVRQGTRRSLVIPQLAGHNIERIVPGPDWEQMLVVYSPPSGADYDSGAEIAVYSFDAGQRLYVGSADLPSQDSRDYGWLDARTVFVAGAYGANPAQPVYGIDYDASGLPACLVRAFPNDYTDWLELWEALSYRMRSSQLDRLAASLCAALPASAADVIPALTPTAPFSYRSAPTPAAYAIPGVPGCLTERFSRDAVRYAALWRQIAATVDDAQRAELEVMICEGLIGSVSSVQPTPTINPNLDVPPTPTPVEGAPQTTGGGAVYRPRIIAIDIETGQRSEGDYLPPSNAPAPPDTSLLIAPFVAQFNRQPSWLQVSADGLLAAELDSSGFIRLYRLARPLGELAADAARAAADSAAQQVRSIGLLPSPTAPYRPLGELHPTLTPTVTPTPIPLAQSAPPGWQADAITELCPARTLYSSDNLPPDYAAVGRLFTFTSFSDVVQVLEPEDGRAYGDDALPKCGYLEDCRFSFDGQWVARYSDRLIVSRPDGSQATTIATDFTIDPNQYPYLGDWLPDNTLRLDYYGDYEGDTVRIFDPRTGLAGEPFIAPEWTDRVQIGELPTEIIARQPGGRLALARTPYGLSGGRYWILDLDSGAADYFARVDSGSISAYWHPLGHTLYYILTTPEGQQAQYAFDARSGAHYRLPQSVPDGAWSPDGRYRMYWFREVSRDEQARIDAGELPLKLEMWDSQTGSRVRYCLPQTGMYGQDARIVWSPDERYVAFVVSLPIDGDAFPTPGPTPVPYTPEPTRTPVPLEVQYSFGFPRTIVFDTHTGYATVLAVDDRSLLLWTDDGGAR